MPEVLFKVDLTKPMEEQDLPGHNRWHPDIPAVAAVNPGAVFRIECKDWTDGQIQNNDDPSDIRDVNLKRVHVLSGPIWVNGAEPGDLLVVDILDIGALQGAGGALPAFSPGKTAAAFSQSIIPRQPSRFGISTVSTPPRATYPESDLPGLPTPD